MAATADGLATQAAMAMLSVGANAVDAAIAANAAMAVVAPHLCGMGGDLFVLVRAPDGGVHALNASGRAGSGADAAALRREGCTEMPFRYDVRSVTVPGCVDGWTALHERFGSAPLTEILAPAARLAAEGFPAGPLLVGSLRRSDDRLLQNLPDLARQATGTGAIVRRPAVAAALEAVGRGGRAAFYGGPFGAGLMRLGGGLFDEADLDRTQADWVPPLRRGAFGYELVTIGPNSQGYLTLGSARLAERVGVPGEPADPAWAHLLIEASSAAAYDRPDVLADGADGEALLDAIDDRAGLVDGDRAGRRPHPTRSGDTTYLCTADADGWAVSLIQSNAAGFGSGLVEPSTEINLHNRGMGFNLLPGHPAELGPGRRPPHTLSPALVLRDGELAAVVGTMGGDGQPQILLQVLVRLLFHGVTPGEAVRAARWLLHGPSTGFDTWTGERHVLIEGHAPSGWTAGLAERGHRVRQAGAFDSVFGHAHVIVAEPTGVLAAAADPRAVVGTAAAL